MPPTLDNRITNNQVDQGLLPESQRENVPQPKPVTPINRTDLNSLQAAPTIQDVPTPPPNTDFSSIISRFAPQARPDLDVNRQEIRGFQDQLATRGSRGQELDEAAGLDAAYSRSAQLSEQIADLTGSFNVAIQNEEGFVRPQEFITGRQTFLQNQKAVQVEALSAAQAAVDGNIALAEQRIQTALDREFGDIEAQLEAAKTDYTLNKDEYDRLDKAASEERAAVIAERERKLDEAKTTRKEVMDLMLRAADNGADSATLSRMAKAQNADEALSVGGSFMQEAASPEFRSVGDSLVRINPDGTVSVAFTEQDTAGMTPAQILAGGGSIYDAVEASSGGKQVGENFITTWSKAATTLDQVESLANTFSADKADGSLFGEDAGIFQGIVGAVRSANPVDVKAQTIKNQLNAIVPNLARGIYGEVGVLTDADFDRYAATLPSLSNVEEVQEAVLGITLKAVRNSMINRLETEMKAGRDVSGYVADIEQIEQRIGTLLTPANMALPETSALIEAGADEAEIKQLFEAGYDVEDVEDYYLNGGTSQSGGDVSFNDAIAASAEAIAAVESGGNYQALGPVLDSGSYAGDRAYGKYQVMGNNIAPWSKEMLGYEITPQQFLTSPQLQDAIFKGRFAMAAKEYGSLQDAASVWFSGRPMEQAGNAQDQLGTSVPEYIKRFNENLNLYA